MLEQAADLWSVDAEAVVITTNGFVKKNGECVMGRGCAREAAQKYPWLPKVLGTHIKEMGNFLGMFFMSMEGEQDAISVSFFRTLITMPVKHNWWEEADLSLIESSAFALRELVDMTGWQRVVMPRPGCGSGKLKWSDVKPMLDQYLDDRFIVVDYPRKERKEAAT